MTNINKKILIGIFTLVSFLISFLLFFNDIINYFIVFSTLTAILFIYLCIEVFKKEKSEEEIYEKNVSNILKRYDSLLVYSDTDYKINENTIVFVKNIEDLIKYCDESYKTIVYIKEDDSSTFVVKNEEELLVYIMKKNNDVNSIMENKINKFIDKNKTLDDISDDIDKTTIIKLKNNKLYKISPIEEENE